jgi:hypothetical protein
VSYSVGAKLSFGDMGEYDPNSEYFIYEADEYDRNFLAFKPYLSLITGIDWDHPDIYPTREGYIEAFLQFLGQSNQAIVWDADMDRLGIEPSDKFFKIREADPDINQKLHLAGLVNRQNAWEVAHAVQRLTGKPLDELLGHLDRFPGVSRRFETIAPHRCAPARRASVPTGRRLFVGELCAGRRGRPRTRPPGPLRLQPLLSGHGKLQRAQNMQYLGCASARGRWYPGIAWRGHYCESTRRRTRTTPTKPVVTGMRTENFFRLSGSPRQFFIPLVEKTGNKCCGIGIAHECSVRAVGAR